MLDAFGRRKKGAEYTLLLVNQANEGGVRHLKESLQVLSALGGSVIHVLPYNDGSPVDPKARWLGIKTMVKGTPDIDQDAVVVLESIAIGGEKLATPQREVSSQLSVEDLADIASACVAAFAPCKQDLIPQFAKACRTSDGSLALSFCTDASLSGGGSGDFRAGVSASSGMASENFGI